MRMPRYAIIGLLSWNWV